MSLTKGQVLQSKCSGWCPAACMPHKPAHEALPTWSRVCALPCARILAHGGCQPACRHRPYILWPGRWAKALMAALHGLSSCRLTCEHAFLVLSMVLRHRSLSASCLVHSSEVHQ